MYAATSAIRSWLVRARRRTRRPRKSAGASATVVPTSVSAASLGLVITSSAVAPVIISRLRRNIDSPHPMTLSISVTSLVRRETISPVWRDSKNAGGWRSTWPNTALRMSVMTRSPVVIMRKKRR